MEPMRIQRALARAGVASRRHAEELVAAGRVKVNGKLATIGQSVDPSRDRITVDDAPIAAPPTARQAVWTLLHKPAGVVTTRRDPQQRPTVFELVPDAPGLTYVGRLDFMTEGVLLLTTDGTAANALTHPSRGIERTYVATVRGNVARAAREVRAGVELEDGPVHALGVDAVAIGNGRHEFHVTIAEGRNREVRRLCEAVGLDVERLVRTRFGPIELGRLKTGEHRPLKREERQAIAKLVKGG
jgi:23S rRNA pseudouridine2605 synthase